jgi:hypothetical protein
LIVTANIQNIRYQLGVGTGPARKPVNWKTEAIISPEPGPAFAHKQETGLEKTGKKPDKT